MRSKRNHGVIYTGKVGRRMPIRKRWTSRRIFYKNVKCCGGPLDGAVIKVCQGGDLCTLPIVCRGQAGLYRNGAWHPA